LFCKRIRWRRCLKHGRSRSRRDWWWCVHDCCDVPLC
jgi:hypothetical protein